MNWTNIVEYVTPYMVKIETPVGSGTGFLCLYNEPRTFCGIATAKHVVDYAEDWQQPIRIRHFPTANAVLLKESERVIYPDWKTDSAVILFSAEHLDLPETPIQLLPSQFPIGIGIEVGWLGFPAIEPNTLCFFSGNISARRSVPYPGGYLIDGVAIAGVSGGPVLYSSDTEGVQIVGTVSAYQPSKTREETLPGLLVAQDVSHFQKMISQVRN